MSSSFLNRISAASASAAKLIAEAKTATHSSEELLGPVQYARCGCNYNTVIISSDQAYTLEIFLLDNQITDNIEMFGSWR